MNCRVCNSALDSSGYCSNCGFDEGLAYEYYPTLQTIDGLSISERRKKWEEKIAAENSIPASNVKCEFNNGTIGVSGSGSIAASDLQCVIPGSTSAKPDFDKIKKVIIGNGITEIEDDCFANFPALESVFLPDGLLAIGKSAFCLCHSLATIAIPDTCTSIGNNAFSFCRSLRSIHLPRKLTTIESHLFWGCESLASIIIPDRVSSIGDRAFAQCGSLTSITIPDSVLEISHSSFLSCRNLKDIYYSGTVEEWNALTLQNNGPYFPDVVMHFGTTSKGFQSKPSGVSEPPRKSINAPATASSTHSEKSIKASAQTKRNDDNTDIACQKAPKKRTVAKVICWIIISANALLAAVADVHHMLGDVSVDVSNIIIPVIGLSGLAIAFLSDAEDHPYYLNLLAVFCVGIAAAFTPVLLMVIAQAVSLDFCTVDDDCALFIIPLCYAIGSYFAGVAGDVLSQRHVSSKSDIVLARVLTIIMVTVYCVTIGKNGAMDDTVNMIFLISPAIAVPLLLFKRTPALLMIFSLLSIGFVALCCFTLLSMLLFQSIGLADTAVAYAFIPVLGFSGLVFGVVLAQACNIDW